jgi:DNA-binding MarR family transcriptional regulator
MAAVKRSKRTVPAKRTPREVDLSSLWNIAGFKLRMLDLRMMKSFSERLAEAELTPAAATVVLVLDSNPGLPLGKLADALMVRHPNMTKLVKRLEGRSLIRRSTAVDDKRSISLALTPVGQRLARRLRALQAKHDAIVLAGLTSAEQAQLMMLVARMLQTLDVGRRKPG